MNINLKKLVIISTVFVITLLGSILRFIRLRDTTELPIANDALIYLNIAKSLKNDLTLFGMREPGFPLLIAFVLSIFGEVDIYLRYTTVFLSILLIPFAYYIGKKMARNEVVGILSAALIAIQNWFVLNSAIGLREELISLLSLLLIFLFFKKVEEFNSRRRVVHYFVLAAVTMYISLTTLTTSISLIITIGLVGYLIDFKRLKEKHSGKALFLHPSMIKVYIIVSSFLIVYIPWGVHLFLETGHFNYMSRWQASFFYRVERGDSTWIDISFLDFIFNVRPFTETVGIYTIGLFEQVQHLFIGPALGGFLAFGFLLFGFFKTGYRMQVFIVLFFSIHLLSLALFSYFLLDYRYYLHLECFLLIFVSKGMVDFYNFMRTKPAHFAVEVPILTRIQKKLGKKFNKIRAKSEIKLDEKVMIIMSLTVIGITLMDSPHYLEYILLGCGMVVLGYLILNNFVDLQTWKLVMFIDGLFQYEKDRFDKNDRSSKKEETEIEKVKHEKEGELEIENQF